MEKQIAVPVLIVLVGPRLIRKLPPQRLQTAQPELITRYVSPAVNKPREAR